MTAESHPDTRTRISKDSGTDHPAKGADVAAPVLGGLAFLFALMLISAASAAQDSFPLAWAGLILAPLIPLFAMLVAYARKRRDVGNWLAGAWLLTLLALGMQLAQQYDWLQNAPIWGIIALLGLGLAALFRSGVSLCISGFAAIGWVLLSYAAQPGTEFLWSFLAVAAIGMAIARRDHSMLGALIFTAALAVWTGLSLQTAISLHALGMVEAGFMGALFLLTCALLLRATQGKETETNDPAILLLLILCAGAAAFALSPFATTSHMPGFAETAYWLWVACCAVLLILALIGLVSGHFTLLDQAALLVLMILCAFAILLAPNLILPVWWKAAGAGLLSLSAIWFALRTLHAGDHRAGIVGLGICGGTLLLTSTGLQAEWQRIALFAAFSFTVVGLYLVFARKPKPKSAS